MALAEVARFAGLPEAEVACSALRANGLDAVVLDREPAQNLWREPYGKGGIRLCVPQGDEAAAKALLRDLTHDAAQSQPWDHPKPTTAERFTVLRLVIIAVVFAAILAFALLGRFGR